MAASNLAGSSTYSPSDPSSIYAGEAPIVTGRAPALATITKMMLCALTTTGVTPYVVATHSASQMVLAAEDTASGKACPYFQKGYFNPAVITWPASLNTLALQKAALMGSELMIERLLPV